MTKPNEENLRLEGLGGRNVGGESLGDGSVGGKLTAGNRLVVTLEKPVHGGAVLTHLPDGRALFVRNGIPGEVVEVEITASHKRHAWANVTEVIEPSPHRVPHIWPEAEAENVGGVELGHVAPSYQRVWKTEVLHDALRRIGGEDLYAQIQALPEGVVVRGTPKDEAATATSGAGDTADSRAGDQRNAALLGRRVRIQLTADAKRRLGMNKFRSEQVVPLDRVPVARAAIEDSGILTGKRWRKLWNPNARITIEAPDVGPPVVVTKSGVYQKPGEKGPTRSQWRVDYKGITYPFETTAGSFWQTHVEAPEVLVSSVMEGANPTLGQRIVELYSGAGLFTRFLGDAVSPSGKVVSLEGSRKAVEDAGRNLSDLVESGVVDVFEGRVNAKNIADLVEALGGPVDTVVLDPPRKGAGTAIVEAVCASAPQTIVLVSCDVAAGSRDLKDFVTRGYRVERMAAWDLFPHTHHVEVVTTLTKA